MEEPMEQWRVELGALSVTRRQQISKEMPINNATLSRWIIRESSPQNEQTVRKLARAAPEIAQALKEAYPNAFETDELQVSLPLVLKIISDHALISKNLNPYTLTNEVGEGIALQLDLPGDGLVIMPFLCMPDENGVVTQLRLGESYGTGDWAFQQTVCPFEIGSDSLCGFAVEQLRPAIYPYQHKIVKGSPTLYSERIKSAIAFPLLRRGECAGALFIGSVHEDFFTRLRRDLCKVYSELYALAFYDHQFYSPSQIKLK